MTIETVLAELAKDHSNRFFINGTDLICEQPVRFGVGTEQVVVVSNVTLSSLREYFGVPVQTPVEVVKEIPEQGGNKKSERN